MVIPQHKDFVANNSSSRHALLTIILVYHMYEWVHGKKFSTEHFNSTYENRGEMAEMFELAGKISNGTKHFRRKVKTQVQHGFSSAFSDAFARPLNVEFNGKKQSVDSFLRKMVEFWKHQEQVGVF
ncbi:MAG: hypothetical protein F4224_09175 [Nitrospira sp. SB0678_bin_10]|nr:hypothetical protein [Nitrospira sp. SB0678_bin_10]